MWRINIYHHDDEKTHNLLKKILMNQQELLAALNSVKDEVDKSKTEITTKIADLEAALANAGGTTPEVDAALAALKTSVQAVDDIVPDTTP